MAANPLKFLGVVRALGGFSMSTLHATGHVRITANFIHAPQALFEQLVNEIAWDSRIRARKAASFGVPYNYSGIEWPAAPFPESLTLIRELVASSLGFQPNNCLAHHYPNGDSTMGFHSDATDELVTGTGIAVVSLGAERRITFRRIEKKSVEESHLLPSGSLLWMSGEMQDHWLHAILADRAITGGRVSLTFRQMRG